MTYIAVSQVAAFLRGARVRAAEINARVSELSAKIGERRSQYYASTAHLGDDDASCRPAEVGLELSTAEDVTEELRVQQAALEQAYAVLEKTYLRYADLFENAPDAYVVTDRRGTMDEVNSAAAALLGLPRSFLIGKNLLHFVARGDTRVFRATIQALAEARTLQRLIVRMRPRHQAPVPVAISAVTIATPHGVAGIRWILRPAPEDDAADTSCHPADARTTTVAAAEQMPE